MRRDWKTYNQHPVKRGTILIAPQLLIIEEETEPKRGRPYTYPTHLILMILFFKFALRLPYRQTQGLAQTIFGKIRVPIPNFRTLNYRLKKMKMDFPNIHDLPDGFMLIADSTSMKLTNSEEWMRNKHREGSKKRWVKLHVVYDPVSKQVIELDVTDERVHDSKRIKKLIEGAKEKLERKGKNISKVIGDRRCHTCWEGGEGERRWEELSGYGVRWFGEYLSEF